jgi:hypothetical protein
MMTLTLPNPPGYEYETIGPWFVSHVRGDTAVAAVMWTMDSAVRRFWGHEEDTHPDRRTMVDARGYLILGTDHFGSRPVMVGTRETMDATLALTEHSSPEVVLEVLAMVERVREMNGGAL